MGYNVCRRFGCGDFSTGINQRSVKRYFLIVRSFSSFQVLMDAFGRVCVMADFFISKRKGGELSGTSKFT